MDSRGSLNGSEINSQPANGGNFLVDCIGTANTSVNASASIIRRAVGVAKAVVGHSGEMLLTARRTARSVTGVTVYPTAKVVRRVVSQLASQTTLNGTARLVRRVTGALSTNTRIDADALVSWRFINRTERDRIIALNRPRWSIVQTDTRRMSVPARRGPMMVPHDTEVMP